MKSKQFLDKIKNFVQKKDNLIVLVLTGILLLVIAWPVSDSKNEKTQEYGLWDKKNVTVGKNNLFDSSGGEEKRMAQDGNGLISEENKYETNEYLEDKLEEILSTVYGVGKVKVMVTLSDYGEKIIEKDIPLERSNVTENDSAGGSRNTNEMNTQEATVYVTGSDGGKIPYVMKEKSPIVEGVTVVAQGGGNAEVQKNISDVIQALFGLEAHKIIVVKMKQVE